MPGAIATNLALLDALVSVLCGDHDWAQRNDGVNHHLQACSKEQLVIKLVAASGDGASVI